MIWKWKYRTGCKTRCAGARKSHTVAVAPLTSPYHPPPSHHASFSHWGNIPLDVWENLVSHCGCCREAERVEAVWLDAFFPHARKKKTNPSTFYQSAACFVLCVLALVLTTTRLKTFQWRSKWSKTHSSVDMFCGLFKLCLSFLQSPANVFALRCRCLRVMWRFPSAVSHQDTVTETRYRELSGNCGSSAAGNFGLFFTSAAVVRA